MNRILVIGYTPFSDGINTFIRNTYPYIDKDMFQYDFLVMEHHKERIEQLDKFKPPGGNIYYLDYNRREMPSRSYKRLKDIYLSIPDLKGVHVHDIGQMTYPLYLADRMGMPIKVIQFHSGFSKYDPLLPIDSHTRGRLNLIRGDRFDRLACSDLAGVKGFRGMPFDVIPNGIVAEKFAFNPFYRQVVRDQLNVDETQYVIGFFANISDVKNPLYALRIFQEFLKLAPNSLFIFVGTNKKRTTLINYVNDHNLMDHVRFLHTDDSIDMLYSASDLALCTSLSEGIGFAWIEAQASGLPCLISDAVPEQINITDLVHMMSLDLPPEEWAKKALQILQSRKERRSYTKEIIDGGFHAKNTAEKLQEIYSTRLLNN